MLKSAVEKKNGGCSYERECGWSFEGLIRAFATSSRTWVSDLTSESPPGLHVDKPPRATRSKPRSMLKRDVGEVEICCVGALHEKPGWSCVRQFRHNLARPARLTPSLGRDRLCSSRSRQPVERNRRIQPDCPRRTRRDGPCPNREVQRHSRRKRECAAPVLHRP